ncbi:MAG: hypothetical protein IIA19_08885 [Thaumarchaeota archaeon]|nr:hypothetical protein [Nitrososphaerota archaeon]
MATFEDFYNDLASLVEKYEKRNTPLKLEQDLDNNIIKIFGEKITALARAKNGLNDVTELAYTTAEHHPYWNVLYNSSEIANTILEKWTDKISKEDVGEIEWAIKEIVQTLERIKEKI